MKIPDLLSADTVESRAKKYNLISTGLHIATAIFIGTLMYTAYHLYSFLVNIFFLFSVMVTIITARYAQSISTRNMYCNMEQAEELIKLARKDNGIAFVLTNINALNRKPTVAEYHGILLVAQKRKKRKVFNELANLKILASAKNDDNTNIKESDS